MYEDGNATAIALANSELNGAGGMMELIDASGFIESILAIDKSWVLFYVSDFIMFQYLYCLSCFSLWKLCLECLFVVIKMDGEMMVYDLSFNVMMEGCNERLSFCAFVMKI